MNKITVHTILDGIGIRALREYIYRHLQAPDFHSHDFTSNFGRFFPDEYNQMLELHARKGQLKNEIRQ